MSFGKDGLLNGLRTLNSRSGFACDLKVYVMRVEWKFSKSSTGRGHRKLYNFCDSVEIWCSRT